METEKDQTVKCEFDNGCKFNWDEYKKTLERFDTRVSETEQRLQKQINEITAKVKGFEQTVPDKLRVLEDAVLKYLPEQRILLDQVIKGQDGLHGLIGEISAQIKTHDKEICNHAEKIAILQEKAKKTDLEAQEARYQRWINGAKLGFGMFLLTVWVAYTYFIRGIYPAIAASEPAYAGPVILIAVTFIFGENAVRRGFNAIRNSGPTTTEKGES